MDDPWRLAITLVVTVIALIALIVRYKVTPFIALMIAAAIVAFGARIDAEVAIREFTAGVGNILGSTAIVIGLGAILGALLAESGGATAIGSTLTAAFGSKRLVWALFAAGILVGLGTWFTVGLVLLAPVLWSVSHQKKLSQSLPLMMSALAGLSAMHGLVPPHPGPLAAIESLKADMGATIFWSFTIASISGAIVGPACWYWTRISLGDGVALQSSMASSMSQPHDRDPTKGEVQPPHASLAMTALVCILTPVVCMLMATVVRVTGMTQSTLVMITRFIGDPMIAMLLGTLLAYWLLGHRRGLDRSQRLALTDRSLLPVANVLLIVGAGAGLSKVLIASGAATMMTDLARDWSLPPLVVGWTLAALIRVATGSATTAIATSSGLLAEMFVDHPEVRPEFLVVAMGAGSLTLSHVNDGGFWFVKEYFGMTVQQTLRTWTVLETAFSAVALAIVLLIDRVL